MLAVIFGDGEAMDEDEYAGDVSGEGEVMIRCPTCKRWFWQRHRSILRATVPGPDFCQEIADGLIAYRLMHESELGLDAEGLPVSRPVVEPPPGIEPISHLEAFWHDVNTNCGQRGKERFVWRT